MRLARFSALFALLIPTFAAARSECPRVTRSAQRVQRPENSITLNLLPVLLNVFDVTYEHVLSPQVAVQFTGGFQVPEPSLVQKTFFEGWPGTGDREVWGLKAGVGMRWFVGGHAPTGFFISPGAQIFSLPQNRLVVGGGQLMVGGAWLVANRFHMSVGGGVQYMVIAGRGGAASLPLPAAQFSMGPAF